MKRKILTIAMVFALLIGMVGCGAKSECKALIKDLETGLIEMDVEAILDCYNPDTVAPLKAILGAIGSGTETVQNAVYDLLGITVEEGDDSREVLKNVKLDVEECDLADESGTVTCKLTIQMDEDTVEKELVFEVVKIEDQWYIDGLK